MSDEGDLLAEAKRVRRRALLDSAGFQMIADDGPMGLVESTLEDMTGAGAEGVVVRRGGLLRPDRVDAAWRSVDREKRLVFADGLGEEIGRASSDSR